MPHLRLSRLASTQPAACSSRGVMLSCREKRWKRRVVEHSVLASTIVSLEFLDLSATRIRLGGFLVCADLELPFFRSPFGQTSRK